jgi:hypothetical protein
MPTVQRYIEAYRVLRNPLPNTIAGALLDAGDQGGIVDDAAEHLALRWLGLARPRREGAATHGCRGAL